MAVRTLEKATITTNAIAQARQRAIDLCTAAWTPQPVKQPDGSTLLLCWNGRIARGYELLAEARIRRDAKAVGIFGGAIRGLEAKYTAAINEAEHAAADWAAMCAAAGQTVQATEVYPPECTCEGCKMQRSYQDKATARALYVTQLYALLCPTSFDLPPFMELGAAIQGGDAEARNRLAAHFQRIYEAGERYAAACDAAVTRANWRALWPDDEGTAA